MEQPSSVPQGGDVTPGNFQARKLNVMELMLTFALSIHTKMRKKTLPVIKNDPWLKPFAGAIEGRHVDALKKEAELTAQCGSLVELANAHKTCSSMAQSLLEKAPWVPLYYGCRKELASKKQARLTGRGGRKIY